MHWCPSVGVTFHSSSTDESETGTTVRFSRTISGAEFASNTCTSQWSNIYLAPKHHQLLIIGIRLGFSLNIAVHTIRQLSLVRVSILLTCTLSHIYIGILSSEESGNTVRFSSTISDVGDWRVCTINSTTSEHRLHSYSNTHAHYTTPEWLPWLQTSWRDSGLFSNFIRQPERKLPRPSLIMHFERGHTCMYQRACNNNHYLAEHLRENQHQLASYFWNVL